MTQPTADIPTSTSHLPSTEVPYDDIRDDKTIRRDLDEVLQRLKSLPPSRERSLAITNLQQSIMWLGMDLKRLNDGKSCYPESYNPDSPVVEPVSDGIKL